MNEKEKASFRLVYEFYQKWRETILETQEDYDLFAEDVGRLARDLDIDHNPLGWHLMYAAVEALSDLYRDGRKPVPANYFGRDDL